jgi:hypothetical protein
MTSFRSQQMKAHSFKDIHFLSRVIAAILEKFCFRSRGRAIIGKAFGYCMKKPAITMKDSG